MTTTVTCVECRYTKEVSRARILKSGKRPKCDVCGKPMVLEDDVLDELQVNRSRGAAKCGACKSPLPAGSSFCAKCGTSGDGDARERYAVANFQLDKQIERRLGWMRFSAFLLRFFRWF